MAAACIAMQASDRPASHGAIGEGIAGQWGRVERAVPFCSARVCGESVGGHTVRRTSGRHVVHDAAILPRRNEL